MDKGLPLAHRAGDRLWRQRAQEMAAVKARVEVSFRQGVLDPEAVAIGRALLSRPRLLLLDEPSMGLAPLIVEKIFEVVQSVAREGVTILLVEQNANLALEFAQRGYVMESGRITLTGSGSALLQDPKVRAAYLGEEA